MHPSEIFIRHLDTIRLYVGANEISIFHKHINDSFRTMDIPFKKQGVIIGELSQLDSFVGDLTKQKASDNTSNSVQIIQQDAANIYIKLTNNMVVKPNDLLSKSQKTLIPRKSSNTIPPPSENYWLKLVFTGTCPLWLINSDRQLANQQSSSQITHLYRLLESTNPLINMLLDYISLSSDPLTMLCSRTVLQNKLTILAQSDSVGLIMLHCIDFNQINKKFGHQHGDNVIREIAKALSPITRESDILSRFSGALFGIGFSVKEKDDVTHFAKKLQRILQHNQYLDGAINLTFNIGAATIKQSEVFKTSSERASSLINRADQALTAAQQEKTPSIITWTNDDFSLYQQDFNYLGGIFTADTVTDYRNMLLLWDISSLIAEKHAFPHLLQSVVQRLAQTFEFQCAGVISSVEETDSNLLYSIGPDNNVIDFAKEHEVLKPTLHKMQAFVQSNNNPSERFFEDKILLVLPLKIDTADCFFISGTAESFKVTYDTKVLLSGLIRQLGKALRRSSLEEELNRKLETQNEQLQHELAVLKEGLQESNIVFQSAIMHNLMKHTKRAAITDTTVLVTGESGTGKERLIHALHTLGPRADKPFVIVDCGSIPETLIESELFGYVKGAFTGAQNSSKGKIADANGGVLVLDEIGELPIQMQTKLLRFVQEKHYTPVGGNKLLDVDVKIIAVTNRDLAAEVESGTFRRDLYYRLNVLTLHNPPLRERHEDIPLLSKHFLNKFAKQFNSEKKSLSVNAMHHMQQYTWPGNIRELENRLMQATLMCEGNVIEWDLLNINENHFQPITPTDKVSSANNQFTKPAAEFNTAPPIFQQTQPPTAPSTDSDKPIREVSDKGSALEHLATVLADSFKSYHQHPDFFNAPIGLWIEDDLILQTYNQSAGKMRATAARLHISQSKARRRVDKILAMQTDEPQYRPPNWANIEQALLPIANGNVVINDCLAELKLTVMKVILDVATFNMAQAAEMLGVSEPTFYKLKKALNNKA